MCINLEGVNYIRMFIDQSSLTHAQVESLLLYRRVVNGEITLREAAKMRTIGPVTVGAYQRVVKQGRRNLQEAMVTILLGTKVGLLKRDELVKLVDLVGKSPDEMSGEQERVLVTLVSALLQKLVM